ncbi:MAG: hypothetical protein IT343_16295, partial [Candidatus Melainabacteria bacterium]|nr:hypothetical protein [Candidatus Melainabacteria bacterium]
MRSTKNNSTVSLITAASMILGLAAVEETTRTQAAHAATTSSARLLAQTVDGKQGIPLTSTTVANIAEKVAPAIVNIEVNQPFMTGNINGFPFGNIPDGFDFFFNGQRMNPRQGGGSQARPNMPERHNTGTGFIVREDG